MPQKLNKEIQEELGLLWKTEYPLQPSSFPAAYNWYEGVVTLSSISYKRKGKLSKADIIKIEKYKDMICKGFVFAPIVVFWDNRVLDGVHRCYAYQSLGIQSVRAYCASIYS